MSPAALRHHHLFDSGPKRILSLDGGGVRGVISLAFLERIEALLQSRLPPAQYLDFLLCHYVSLIGGTSTGAIVAAGLAIGHTVTELIDLYLHISHESFVRREWFGLKWFNGSAAPSCPNSTTKRCVRPSSESSGRIRRVRTASPAGSPSLRNGWIPAASGCSTITRMGRLSGRHPPRVLTRQTAISKSQTCCARARPPRHILGCSCWKWRRAWKVCSRMAESARTTTRRCSCRCRPRCRATASEGRIGEENPMLLSLGTGASQPAPLWGRSYRGESAAEFAVEALFSAMNDSSWLAQAVLQRMSSSPTALRINREVGDRSGDLPGGKNLLHYLRYDAPIERDWFRERLGLEVSPDEVRDLRHIDRPENAKRLSKLAAKPRKHSSGSSISPRSSICNLCDAGVLCAPSASY